VRMGPCSRQNNQRKERDKRKGGKAEMESIGKKERDIEEDSDRAPSAVGGIFYQK